MELRPRRLPYSAQFQMAPNALSSFSARGGRFRTRGAPMATPPIGLSTSNPSATAARDASWGATFGANSTYGNRPLTSDRITISPVEQKAIAARTTGVAQTNLPFMPDQAPKPLRLPNMKLSPTDPSGDAAALARNQAMMQPGGLAGYQSSNPDAYHQQVIADATAYHQENGIPLPDPVSLNPSATANEIVSKYGNASATFVPGQNDPNSPNYRARLQRLAAS